MAKILKNISLKPYNTFGIDVKAKEFVSVVNDEKLKQVLQLKKGASKFIISGGSNMLLTQNINATVIHIATKGITIDRQKDYALVTAKAGENWHEFVQYCIKNNLGGLENLSLIPGYVGSCPIQNIGAYGVEIKDTFVSCKAIDIETLEFKVFTNDDCNFGYRDSIFKNSVKNKYIITEVTFQLTTSNHQLKTNYGAIEQLLYENKILDPTIQDVASAVIKIRQSKLPDPAVIGNSGSFFKNPVIAKSQLIQLQEKYPEIPSYKVSDTQVKVPAGWLIDQANFKGYTHKNAGVHEKQALVLTNKTGKATGKEILELSQIISNKIKDIFGIKLVIEVNVI